MGSNESPALDREFGDRLRGFRERAGLSIADVFSVFSLLGSMLAKYEAGEVIPHLKQVECLLKLYRCSYLEIREITELYREVYRKLPAREKLARLYVNTIYFVPALIVTTIYPSRGLGVFISYRRSDEGALAGRLYDVLVKKFRTGVFIDVASIELGLEYEQVLRRSVRTCQVMIVVIGKGWLAAEDESGGRRLDDPNDVVRMEIEEGLERGLRVIPVLIDGATMPTAQQMPTSIAALQRRNAHHIWNRSFGTDCQALIDTLKTIESGLPD